MRSPYILEGGSGKGRVTTEYGNGETKLHIRSVSDTIELGPDVILINGIRFQLYFYNYYLL